MAMQESVRSLRIYFILSGVLSLWFGSASLTANLRNVTSPSSLIAMVVGVVGLVLALAFVYVGACLAGLLRNSPERVVMLLYVSGGWAVFTFLLGLLNGVQVGAIVILSITLLIVWYLLTNVTRLASESPR